jgi:homoserine/homoserine lactone efflux protein
VTVCEMSGLALYAWLADAMNARFQSPAFTRAFNRLAAAAMFASALFAAVMTSV